MKALTPTSGCLVGAGCPALERGAPRATGWWRSRGFGCRRTAELGEIDMSQGSQNNLITLGSRAKAIISQKPEADLLAGLRRSPGLPRGHRYQWRTCVGYSSAWTLLEAVILFGSLSPKPSSAQEPVVPVLGCLKPDPLRVKSQPHPSALEYCAKLLQSCLTLCNPVDCSPCPWDSLARTLEWVARVDNCL